MSEEIEDNPILHAAQQAHEAALSTLDNLSPKTGLQSGLSTPVQVQAIDTTRVGQALETPQALKNAAGPNAQVIIPGTGANVVNPKTGLSHNAFTWFHQHILSKLPSVFSLVGDVAIKTEEVVQASANSPEYATAQSNLVASALALATAASLAVAEKGLNPMQDKQTIQLLEDLVSKTHSYVGVLETEYQNVNAPKPATV